MSGQPPVRVAVLTVSDRCARGESTDASGPAVAAWVRERLDGEVVEAACVADETAAIAARLTAWARADLGPDLVLTTGGTGLAPRDVTPEATLAVLERRHAGLLELARLRCLERTPLAFLSRGEAGTIGRTLVINLPGSPRGAVEVADALADVLPHAIQMLRGKMTNHDVAATTTRPKETDMRTNGPIALLVLMLSLVLGLLGGRAAAAAGEVRVAAAISLQEALIKAAAEFERQGGDRVRFTFASSGQLLAQIKTGAPVDVFVSAAEKQMNELMEAGDGDPATRRVVATNTLVLIVPAGTDARIGSFEKLADPAVVRRLAVGEPQTVPAGQYAQQVLERLELTEAVAPRVVYGANVRQVLDYVQRGEVSAGVVYATDAAQAGDQVRVVATAPAGSHEPIVYPAAVVTGAANAEAGRRFLTFLASDAGRKHLVDHGFGGPPGVTAVAPAATTQPAGRQ